MVQARRIQTFDGVWHYILSLWCDASPVQGVSCVHMFETKLTSCRYVMMFKLFDQYWYAWWMWDLTHHALYWSILASLAWLFKPSADNVRLRFNPQDQQDQQVIEPLRVNEDEDEDYDFD